MKRILAIILIMTLVFTMTACGGGESGEGSSGEPVTFVVGTEAPQDSTTGQLLEGFKSRVEEKSEGTVKVQIEYSAVLGSESQMVEQVQLGTLDLVLPGSAILAAYDERCEIFDIPFLFKDNQAVLEAYEGEIGEEYNAWLEEQGFYCFGIIPNGARGISNSKHEVKTPDDLKGLKIRVMESDVYVDLFNALGANTVTMNYGDIYSALQQGVIDGQDNPPEFTVASGFNDLNNYYTLLNHTICVMPVVGSKAKMESMDESARAIIEEEMNVMIEEGIQVFTEAEEGYVQQMRDSGNVVTELTDQEREAFAEKAKGIQDEYRELLGDEIIDLAMSFN